MLLVSVFIKFDPWGRMGNRMFQYAFGYLLAKQRNVPLYTEGLPNFNIPSTPFSTIEPPYIETIRYGNNYVNYQELLKYDKNIIINSFVQKASYYKDFRNELRTAFNINTKQTINPNKLVLHIRETDYKDIGCFLGYENYKKLINRTGFNEVIIVTDNSNCDTVQMLLKDGYTLNTEGYVNIFDPVSDDRAMNDFYTLLYSENIAISQSSFSWWAAFLGFHKNVYLPYTTQVGIWKEQPKKDDIDLFYFSEETHKLVL